MAAPRNQSTVTIRRAMPADAAACGQICYDAFHKISSAHNFPPDIPEPGHAIGLLTGLFSHPSFYCVVAEVDGRIAGSNCLDERSAIVGIGPITVDPTVQNSGVGRALMRAVLDRANAATPASASSRRPSTTGRCRCTRSWGSIRGSRWRACKANG